MYPVPYGDTVGNVESAKEKVRSNAVSNVLNLEVLLQMHDVGFQHGRYRSDHVYHKR
jgi:hypothetical protein